MNNIILRIEGKIFRTLSKLFNCRPASHPFISGDGFRSIANHIYDETQKCLADSIRNGDVVFLKTEMIKEWFEYVHPKIIARYKLITHNSDAVVGESESKYIDDKIIHWFAQNNIFEHKKITPIPIGIENRHLYMSGWILLKKAKYLIANNVKKNNRILYGFSIQTNPEERAFAFKKLKLSQLTDEIRPTNQYEYLKKLINYNFLASPNGNGPDCHRTWEALYLKVIPIVTKNINMEYFKSIGLPIMIIDNWNSIEDLDEAKLQEVSQHTDLLLLSETLTMGYWKWLINNK